MLQITFDSFEDFIQFVNFIRKDDLDENRIEKLSKILNKSSSKLENAISEEKKAEEK